MQRLIPFTTLLLLCSCSSMPWANEGPEPVDAGLLVHVPESDKQTIQEARAERAGIREDLAIAQRDLEQVGSRQNLAKGDLDVLENRVDEAEDRVEHAREYGTQQELAAAQDDLETARSGMRFGRAKLLYYEDLQELAERVVELEQSRLELATARVNLHEAEAIARLGRPATEDMDVNAYVERVRRLEDEVAMNQVEVRTAHTRIDLRKELLDDRANAVPASFRLNEIEPLDEILTLSLEEREKCWEGMSEEREKQDKERKERLQEDARDRQSEIEAAAAKEDPSYEELESDDDSPQ